MGDVLCICLCPWKPNRKKAVVNFVTLCFSSVELNFVFIQIPSGISLLNICIFFFLQGRCAFKNLSYDKVDSMMNLL